MKWDTDFDIINAKPKLYFLSQVKKGWPFRGKGESWFWEITKIYSAEEFNKIMCNNNCTPKAIMPMLCEKSYLICIKKLFCTFYVWWLCNYRRVIWALRALMIKDISVLKYFVVFALQFGAMFPTMRSELMLTYIFLLPEGRFWIVDWGWCVFGISSDIAIHNVWPAKWLCGKIEFKFSKTVIKHESVLVYQIISLHRIEKRNI